MAHLVRIGNSQGIRIPKALIEQAHLDNKELSLKIVNEGILITPQRQPREGWQESIENMIKNSGEEPQDVEWLDSNLTSEDDFEW